MTIVLAVTSVCAGAAGSVRVVSWQGAINPVAGDFISRQLELANRENQAFVLLLDTPGGLDSSMRQIIKAELTSRVPVIVHVHPSGARAASAGALITLAADFAVMAPGTNIGAAHPVTIGPSPDSGKEDGVMETKVVNDAVAYARSIAQQRGRDADWAEKIVRESLSTPAVEALRLGVIDLVAESYRQALVQLDGRSYTRGGKPLSFAGSDLVPVEVEMGWRDRILNVLSNPNIAYMLLMLGMLGIFFEISQPGVILPGAIGAIALLLAFFGLQTLPVNGVGLLLILLGIVLFLLEIKVVSYGMLSVGGIVALALGSLMLIDSDSPAMRVSLPVIVLTVAVFSGLFLLVLFYVIRAQKGRVVSGLEGMVGERGIAHGSVARGGRVFVHGEYWDAVADEPVGDGQIVEVREVLPGMRLRVAPVPKDNEEERKGEP
ncbi:nodulation efficiency protein NfeD [Geothermobacter ehrlichii]|uniref:Nodulation efficiency protein NfeD n=1 Tax=Geothermobacter ehrlichii TaxID=213224 RepID=A0A5D3WIR7_9BACT|nr:nodulation efficiency protein NfeD [Geothermobacter ehrlichii]